MITAIDTNVLIDVLNLDEKHFDTSKRLLDEALAKGALIISEIVYDSHRRLALRWAYG